MLIAELRSRLKSRLRPVRRRLGPALHRVRTAPALLPWPSAMDRAARATYMAVSDGRALNLCVPLPEQAGEYHVEFIPRRAVRRVLAGPKETTRRAAARLGHDARGRPCAEATVVLGASGLGLSAGRWRLWLAVGGPAAAPRRIPIRAPLPAGRSGPTVAVPPCPDTGTRYIPSVSPLGYCGLTVRTGRPVAEVSRLTLNHAGAEIAGRLVGAGSAEHARFEFVARIGGAVWPAPVEIVDGAFQVAVPLAKLAGPAGTERIWDVWVRVPGARRLRVGRFLHDVRSPSRVFRVPVRVVAPEPGVLISLRPHYTAAGGLRLACLRVQR
jgi:hypothetical protein